MSLRKNETLTSWTLLDILVFTFGLFSNHAQKWRQICWEVSTAQSFIFPKWHSFKIGTLAPPAWFFDINFQFRTIWIQYASFGFFSESVIVTSGQDIWVNKGSTIKLPCIFNHLGKGTSMYYVSVFWGFSGPSYNMWSLR